ncbi:MAG: chromosomal replication initiator protein DnaA [Patescibacteria group bacterium]|nr:chromosomal replication initiator protein DnaA [Patescibacteria group bacterium]
MLGSVWNDFLRFSEETNAVSPMLLSLLKQVKPESITESEVIVGCENVGARIFLEKRSDEISAAISGFLQKKTRVTFVVVEKKTRKQPDEPLFSFKPSHDDIASRAGLNRKYTFDNFAVASSNSVAFAAAQSVAQSPGESYNPLFLYGGVGNGKTHLAQSTARAILDRNPDKKVLFSPGDMFINELIDAIRDKNTLRFRKKYRAVDVLIVDDIQFIAGKQTVQEEFFHTFNAIVQAGGQVILTSDRPPGEIKNLEDRLRSRFSQGLIVDIQPPDFELRTAILIIKAEEKNIMIDMEAAKRIAEHVEDTRALEGTLLTIYAKIAGKQETIDVSAVEDHFHSTITERVSKKIDPNDVIRTVCSYYNVKQTHIKSSTRTSTIALPRQIIMYLLRNELKLKLEDIAYILKRKDHTTVMHGVEKISREVMRDPVMKEDVDRIISSLRQSP